MGDILLEYLDYLVLGVVLIGLVGIELLLFGLGRLVVVVAAVVIVVVVVIELSWVRASEGTFRVLR